MIPSIAGGLQPSSSSSSSFTRWLTREVTSADMVTSSWLSYLCSLNPVVQWSCVQKTCQQTIAASCKDAFTCFWLGIFQTTQLTLSGQHCVQRDVLKPGRFDCRFGFGRMRRFGCHWKKSLSRCRPSTVWAIPQLLQIAHSDPAEWSDKMDFWHIEKMRENLETPQVDQHFPVTPCDPMAFRRFFGFHFLVPPPCRPSVSISLDLPRICDNQGIFVQEGPFMPF